jgi:hypothetical protein
MNDAPVLDEPPNRLGLGAGLDPVVDEQGSVAAGQCTADHRERELAVTVVGRGGPSQDSQTVISVVLANLDGADAEMRRDERAEDNPRVATRTIAVASASAWSAASAGPR